MESFIHVVTYHGLRYMQHNQPHKVNSMMEALFDQHQIDGDGNDVGGDTKHVNFLSRHTIKRTFAFDFPPLTVWLDSAFDLVKDWMIMKLRGEIPADTPTLFDDHQNLRRIWEDCIAQPNWPDKDKTHDQLDASRKKAQAIAETGVETDSPTKAQSKRTRDDSEDVEVERSTTPKRLRTIDKPTIKTGSRSESKNRRSLRLKGTI